MGPDAQVQNDEVDLDDTVLTKLITHYRRLQVLKLHHGEVTHGH